MAAETDLDKLISNMSPVINEGEYVFVTLENIDHIDRNDTICAFKEEEGISIVIGKDKADELNLAYTYVSAWITLKVHSALEAVGLTAFFSKVLADNNISCNVIAGYYHDHIFVNVEDAEKAIKVLENASLDQLSKHNIIE